MIGLDVSRSVAETPIWRTACYVPAGASDCDATSWNALPPSEAATIAACVKMDKIDAAILAQLYASGFLPEVWIPDEAKITARRISGGNTKNGMTCSQARPRQHDLGYLAPHGPSAKASSACASTCAPCSWRSPCCCGSNAQCRLVPCGDRPWLRLRSTS